MQFKWAASAAAALSLLGFQSAGAATVEFLLTDVPNSDLTLTIADDVNSIGYYDILGAAGTVNGETVLGLFMNPNQPYVYTDPDGNEYDNDWAPMNTVPLVTGIKLFMGTHNFFLGANPTGDAQGLWLRDADPGGVIHQTWFTDYKLVTAGVPEPATWALMVLGFGSMGAALRRRRAALAAA